MDDAGPASAAEIAGTAPLLAEIARLRERLLTVCAGHERDIARLRAEAAQEVAAAQARHGAAEAAIERMRSEMQEMGRKLAESEVLRHALLRSTSWRLTAPLRRAVTLIRGG